MTDSQAERASYIAAHRLLEVDLHSNWGTPGRRRTEMVDRIAAIVKQVFVDGQNAHFAGMMQEAEKAEAKR